MVGSQHLNNFITNRLLDLYEDEKEEDLKKFIINLWSVTVDFLVMYYVTIVFAYSHISVQTMPMYVINYPSILDWLCINGIAMKHDGAKGSRICERASTYLYHRRLLLSRNASRVVATTYDNRARISNQDGRTILMYNLLFPVSKYRYQLIR